MAKYNPRFSVTAAPGITGHMLLVLYEASSPNVPVAISDQLPPPHNASVQVQFLDLNPVVHIGKLFETNGVAQTGTVLANFSVDPQFSAVEIRSDLFIYAGTTEGFEVGSNTFTDPTDSLAGWEYSLEIRHTGTIDPELEYEKDASGNPTILNDTEIAGGLGGTYQTFENEIWIFHFLPRIVAYSGSNDSASWFTATEVITANRTLVAGDLGKNFILESATSALEVTLPLLSSIIEHKHMFFMSEGGSHKNVVIKTQGGDQISYSGLRSDVILGQAEALYIYKYNNKYRVSNTLEGVLNVGQLFYSEITETPNSLWCNGQLVSRTTFARLWQFIQNSVSPGLVVTEASWDTEENRGKFSSGDGSTTFRLPRLYDFLRGATGSRLAGTFEDMNVGEFEVPIDQGNSYTGNGAAGRVGRGGVNPNTFIITVNEGEETQPKNHSFYICIKT